MTPPTLTSEFISICPKCRQRILCDSAFVGTRVACPLCMQEITMPAPPIGIPIPPPATEAAASTPSMPPVPARKRSIPLVVALAGVVLLIMAAAVAIGMLDSGRSNPEPNQPPVAVPSATPRSAPVAALPAVSDVPATSAMPPAPAAPAPPLPAVPPTIALPVSPSVAASWITPVVKLEMLRPNMPSGSRPISPNNTNP